MRDRRTRAQLLRALEDAEALNAELQEALHQERKWAPDGLHLIQRVEGGQRRMVTPLQTTADLEALYPRMALLRHRDAIADGLREAWRDMLQTVQRDAQGLPTMLTVPAACDVADTVLKHIEAAKD